LKAHTGEIAWQVLDHLHLKKGVLTRNCYKLPSGAKRFTTTSNFQIFITYKTSDNILCYQLLRSKSRNERCFADETKMYLTGTNNLEELICFSII